MSARYITADWIYPVASPPIQQGVIILEDDRIIELTSRSKVSSPSLEHHQGILIPGFINTHCHLELSHLKGKSPTGTGLLPFLKHVVNFRDIDQDTIDNAIRTADQEMWDNGIQAVGDICNKTDTFPVKIKSKIHYHSFVEMFDFLQESKTDEIINTYLEVYAQAPSPRSVVPHAPYSVSPTLFNYIKEINSSKTTVCIHNQETEAEEELFRKGRGGFFDFYKSFGIELRGPYSVGTSSLLYSLHHLDPEQRTLFVHNTLSSLWDIEAALSWSDQVYWAVCANANLYIENRLPYLKFFIDAGAQMTLGTDSLTSNWQLSILEEMKTIARYQSYVPFDLLLQWATLNGAKALGMDDQLGSIEKGKRPGILLLTMDPAKDNVSDAHVSVRRIV